MREPFLFLFFLVLDVGTLDDNATVRSALVISLLG